MNNRWESHVKAKNCVFERKKKEDQNNTKRPVKNGLARIIHKRYHTTGHCRSSSTGGSLIDTRSLSEGRSLGGSVKQRSGE